MTIKKMAMASLYRSGGITSKAIAAGELPCNEADDVKISVSEIDTSELPEHWKVLTGCLVLQRNKLWGLRSLLIT